jgi:cytochrome c553
MIRKRALFVAVLGSVLAVPAAAAEAEQGGTLEGRDLVAMCQGCHGIPGYRVAYPEVYHVPKLGGQHPSYIAQALQAYKSGARANLTMRAIAATLNEKEIGALAEYYGGPVTKSAASK